MYFFVLLWLFFPPAAVPEQANKVWKEVLSASYSSSTSGNWSWDASDQSVPSTPSPPLSNGASKNFLLSPQADDGGEDSMESTHFMFEDPIPRKRKVRRDFFFFFWKAKEMKAYPKKQKQVKAWKARHVTQSIAQADRMTLPPPPTQVYFTLVTLKTGWNLSSATLELSAFPWPLKLRKA